MKSDTFIVVNKLGEYGVEHTATTRGVKIVFVKDRNTATVFTRYHYKMIKDEYRRLVVAELPAKELRTVELIKED